LEDGARRYADVSIRSPHAVAVLSAAAGADGAAAAIGEAAKRAAYPAVPDAGLAAVDPFVLETFGRLGPAALDLLRDLRQRLAERSPALRGWAGVALAARWHAQINVALHLALFDAAQAMWGCGGAPLAAAPDGDDVPLLWATLPFGETSW